MLTKPLLSLFKRFAWVLAVASLVSCASTPSTESVRIGADDPLLEYSGRTEGLGTPKVTLGYSGARVRLRFEGDSVGMWMDDETGDNSVMVWIDGEANGKFALDAADGYYQLADALDAGPHTVEVVRVTEGALGLIHFRGFALEGRATALSWQTGKDRKIEFIGDSITCGYGVEVDDPNLHFDPATENFCLSYSGLAARRLEADYLVVARSGIGMVRNYDGPREGSEEAMPMIYPNSFFGQSEPKWDFSRFTPDVVCVNLGTNDFSTTGVNVGKFVETYFDFAAVVLERYPKAKLVVLQGPMNNSEELGDALEEVVDRLNERHPGRAHRFRLSAQGTVGLGADYHPNRAQSRINARELSAYLSVLMGWPIKGSSESQPSRAASSQRARQAFSLI